MAKITFITLDGAKHTIEGKLGASVMDAAVKHDIDGIVAECGGACACATCHVHVEDGWYDKLPLPDETEKGMLEFTPDVDATSRLSCQIKVTADLDGIVIRVGDNG